MGMSGSFDRKMKVSGFDWVVSTCDEVWEEICGGWVSGEATEIMVFLFPSLL